MTNRILRDYSLYTPRPFVPGGEQLEIISNSTFTCILRFLGRKIRTDSYGKINLMINSKSENTITQGLGILSYHVKNFDVENFLENPHERQPELMLELGVRYLKNIFQHTNVDEGVLLGVEQFVIEQNFQNTFVGPTSRLGSRSARITVTQSFTNSQVNLLVKNRAKVLLYEPVIDIPRTSPFAFNIFLKKPVWISENELTVSSNNETFNFSLE